MTQYDYEVHGQAGVMYLGAVFVQALEQVSLHCIEHCGAGLVIPGCKGPRNVADVLRLVLLPFGDDLYMPQHSW